MTTRMRPSLLWFAVDNYCSDAAAAADVAAGVAADALEMRDAESGRGHDGATDGAAAVSVAAVPPVPDGVADDDADAVDGDVQPAAAVAAADGAGGIDACDVA